MCLCSLIPLLFQSLTPSEKSKRLSPVFHLTVKFQFRFFLGLSVITIKKPKSDGHRFSKHRIAKTKKKINQTVRMSAKSRSSICSHGKKTKVVSVVVYYDTSKASRDVTSTVRGTKRVNVKLKKGGQELIEHMKKIIAHSDLKGDYNRMDETGTLLTLYLLRCILYC